MIMSNYIANQNNGIISADVVRRPLPDKIKMTQYAAANRSGHYSSSNNAPYRCSGVFDGRCLWVTSNGSAEPLPKLDTQTGQEEMLQLTGEAYGMSISKNAYYYNGHVVLVEEKQLVINVQTGEMRIYENKNGVNGNSGLLPDGSAMLSRGLASDGSNIWMTSTEHIVSIDPNTHTMCGKHLPEPLRQDGLQLQYRCCVWGLGYLWVICRENVVYNETSACLVRINTNNWEWRKYFIDEEKSDFITQSITCDGTNLWFAPQATDYLLKFNITTEAFTKYSLAEGVNSNRDMGSILAAEAKMLSSVYDGKSIWMHSSNANRLYKVNTQSGSIQGIQLGSGGLLYRDLVFDGRNLWLIPYASNTYLKVSPDIAIDTWCITEFFEDKEGNELQAYQKLWVDEGSAYDGMAPHIPCFQYVGYRLDGGALVPNRTVTIPDVQGDHTVTFVYRRENPPSDAIITRHYRTENGVTVRQSAYDNVTFGEEYTATAPVIASYDYAGHRLDGGPLAPSPAVTIPDVQGDHTVIFLYRQDDDPGPGPGPDPSGAPCPHGRLRLELDLPVCNSAEMLRELTDLVAAAKGCDCGCEK